MNFHPEVQGDPRRVLWSIPRMISGLQPILTAEIWLAKNHVRLQVQLNPGGSFLTACRGVLQNHHGECWGVIREAEVTARGGGLAFGFRTAYVLGQTNLKKP